MSSELLRSTIMSKLNKNYEARIMTLLVRVAGGISGAMAVVALVMALLPKASGPVLPALGQSGAQEAQVQIATPYVPGVKTLEGQVIERPARFDPPSQLVPDPY
ncbi:MAG TPA: hypothetical protein VJ183_14470 [Chloroflexia bacterium]|nr:hypothetical protein [Chloroflexia bacterium]